MDNFKDLISDYRSRIDKRLSDYLTEETLRANYLKVNGKYPSSLYEPLNYIMSGGGKRIRPLLMILACEAFGGEFEDAVDASVAIEILHNFTLVHDDIMDNAATRRGKETIHKRWDVNTAILVGDELIGLSYRSLLKTRSRRIDDVVRAFTDGVIEVCEGQAFDKEFESDNSISLDDYFLMIKKKTAELIRISSVIGSIIADAGNDEIELISCYAQKLGFAFQIQDDLLDVVADENEFGKKIGGDILEKKKTYLYLKALELNNKNDRDHLVALYTEGNENHNKTGEVINIYKRSGVVESAKDEIRKYTLKANESLSQLKNEQARYRLKSFSDMLLNRGY
ncbi:MAG: polyprenyl synthetase family protein [Ignavibacteria bacterium]